VDIRARPKPFIEENSTSNFKGTSLISTPVSPNPNELELANLIV